MTGTILCIVLVIASISMGVLTCILVDILQKRDYPVNLVNEQIHDLENFDMLDRVFKEKPLTFGEKTVLIICAVIALPVIISFLLICFTVKRMGKA